MNETACYVHGFKLTYVMLFSLHNYSQLLEYMISTVNGCVLCCVVWFSDLFVKLRMSRML